MSFIQVLRKPLELIKEIEKIKVGWTLKDLILEWQNLENFELLLIDY